MWWLPYWGPSPRNHLDLQLNFMKLRTIVYVDGLNLQRRFFDKSGHYYVDIPAIIRKSLPDFYDITTVKYYTSLLQKPDDNHKQSRLLQAHTNKYKGYFQITYGTHTEEILGNLPISR